jgi:hypothetical protein
MPSINEAVAAKLADISPVVNERVTDCIRNGTGVTVPVLGVRKNGLTTTICSLPLTT